jgi:hypothetical protein
VELPADRTAATVAGVDWAQGVGARLAALSLDGKGRLTSQLMPAAAVRCGVLFDLALAGRLRLLEDGVDVDVRPTGFLAADQLLSAMRDEPDRSLDSWFAERRFGPVQVADALVQAGRWRRSTGLLRRPRYLISDAGQRERDLLLDVTRTEPGWQAEDAAVAALGLVAHLLGDFRALGLKVPLPEIPAVVLASAGEHVWLLQAAVEYLTVARDRYALGASALNSGGFAPR